MKQVVAVAALAFLTVACSSTHDKSNTLNKTRTPTLLAACDAGARSYNGVAIAAFSDPSVQGQVVCWADGDVAMSPPPGVDGKGPRRFDRLVFTARLDGKFVNFVQAGYRSEMPVTPPTRHRSSPLRRVRRP